MGGIGRVGVVGAGQMGLGIAEVCARHGLDVIVSDVAPGVQETGRARIVKSLDRGVKAGKLSPDDRDATLERADLHRRPRRLRRP